MGQSYQSWLKSITAQINHERALEEEAKKIFSSGGRIVYQPMKKPDGTICREKDGSERRIAVLEFGKYKPRTKLSKKSLQKLGIYVEEVKYRDKKKKKREKDVDNKKAV